MASFKTVLFVVSLLMATSSAAPRNNKFDIKVPDGCGETGFCSIRPDGYDAIEEKINSLLSPYLIANVPKRSGGPSHVPETEPDNCPSKIVEEKPVIYTYKNSTKVDIIVQSPELFPQMVQSVICAHDEMGPEARKSDHKQCFSRLEKNEFLNFSCQKSEATRILLVFDPETHQIVTKGYSIPVCCSCQVRNNGI